MRKKEKELPPIEKWVANHVNRVAGQQHVLNYRVGYVLQFRDHVPERMLETLADYLRELADLALKLERRVRPDIRPAAKVINGEVVKKELAHDAPKHCREGDPVPAGSPRRVLYPMGVEILSPAGREGSER